MYIPSIDITTVREEPVAVLNPIAFPQSEDDITFAAVVSEGFTPAEIAAMTGIAYLTPVEEGSATLLVNSDVTATPSYSSYHVSAIMNARSSYGEPLMPQELTPPFSPPTESRQGAETDVDATAFLINQRYLEITAIDGVPERWAILTFALPRIATELPSVSLRLWASRRPVPLLEADTDLFADPIVTPTVTMEETSSMFTYLRGALKRTRQLFASTSLSSDSELRLPGQYYREEQSPRKTNTNRRLSALISRERGQTFFGEAAGRSWADLTLKKLPIASAKIDGFSEMRFDGEPSTIENAKIPYAPDPGPNELEAVGSAGSNLDATLRKRTLNITRCQFTVNTKTVTRGTVINPHPNTPALRIDITDTGYYTVNLTPLLDDNTLVYSLLINTNDSEGFAFLDRNPSTPEKEPCIVFGDDPRSGRQRIPGAYLGSLITMRRDTTVSYPVPLFSTSEARRIAQSWNAVSQYSVNPLDRYTMEWDSNSQTFLKSVIDEDGEITALESVEPIRLGETLLFPMLSYDVLWVLDQSDQITRLRDTLSAQANVEALAETFDFVVRSQSESDLLADAELDVPGASSLSSGESDFTGSVGFIKSSTAETSAEADIDANPRGTRRTSSADLMEAEGDVSGEAQVNPTENP